MTAFWRPIIAILWKDILVETRTKDVMVSILVFALLVVVVFSFAIEPTPQTVALVAPGILWVAITFGGVLGMTRSFSLEQDRGSLRGLLLAPVSRDTIYFGKMLANFIFMMVVEAIVFPIFAVLYDISLVMPGLVPVALLATLGVATIGTVFSAMAANTRAREVMLPVLFFPVAMPALVAAVEASGVVIGGESWGDMARWLPLLAAFDGIFLVICPIAFNLVVEE